MGSQCDWTMEDFKTLLSRSDETKSNYFVQKRYMRRKDCVESTAEHGDGSVMVWGSFSGQWNTSLVRIERIMKKVNIELNVFPAGL